MTRDDDGGFAAWAWGFAGVAGATTATFVRELAPVVATIAGAALVVATAGGVDGVPAGARASGGWPTK